MAAHIRRRLRKGATTTAVAAAAVAALAASQAPAAPMAEGPAGGGDQQTVGGESGGPEDGAATGNSPYYTDLPPLVTPDRPGSSSNLPIATGSAEAGIPATVLAAYQQAERTVASTDAACRLPWQLLAAIGKVESGHARGGRVDADGTTLPDPRPGPQRPGLRAHQGHRRRGVRRRRRPRPRGRPDAVHPVHLGHLGPGRQR